MADKIKSSYKFSKSFYDDAITQGKWWIKLYFKMLWGGVSNNEINEMEKTVVMLSEANAEVDRLREELTPKVKKMNDLMTLVKASYAESKKTLKGYYPQERWPDYGIPDKR